MIGTPAFKAHLRVVPVPGDGVLALTEGAASFLRGDRFARICSLVDGRRNAEEIVQALVDDMNPAVAWSALIKLESAGWIEESRPTADRRSTAFWLALGVDPQQAALALGTADVRILAPSTGLAQRFDAALRQFGIRALGLQSIQPPKSAGPGQAQSGLDVVLAADYLSDELLHRQRSAQATGRRWLLLRPYGATPWIGPLFSPSEAPCLDCLRLRLSRLRPANVIAARHDPEGSTAEPLGALAGTEEIACLMAAAEIAKVLAGSPPALSGIVRTIDLRDLSSCSHRILPHPACKVCAGAPDRARKADTGDPMKIRPLPIRLAEGGFRAVTPEETLRNYERLVSPVGGVVGALIPNTHTRAIGHMFVARDSWPASDTPARVADLRYRFRRSSVGKGMSEAQAKASALCEAVEHYSAMRQGTESIHTHAYNEIRPDAIHPNSVLRYSDRQYRNRHRPDRGEHTFHQRVPAPLDPDERIQWSPVWSLTKGHHKLLPTDLLYLGKPDERTVAYACSNGCAAGNSLEEAIVQGFLELVERDAVAIWWYNRLVLPAIDLESFDDRWLRELRGHYRSLGRELSVIDLTSDLGIPVAAAISHRASGAQERIAIGLGCHLDPAIAVQRAVTETVQMLDIDLSRGAAAMREFADGWMEWATRADHSHLAPDGAARPRVQGDFPTRRFDDLRDCIEHCRTVVESRGMEMLALDLTRADTRMPVARVIVPGLRHFWPRFAPGRLFDAPLTMGLRTSPTPESELNPVPFVF